MEEGLLAELKKRGTAEISGGLVTQVTQALEETETEVTYLQFGEPHTERFISIQQACNKCNFWMVRFKDIKECQDRQGKDAKTRGFNKMICPRQFIP